MKRCLVSARITWFAAILCPVANPAFSRLITADIVGTVSDPAGAIIVGSVVTAENLGTHERRSTPTNGSGEFVFNLLQPGQYTAAVESQGFKTTTVNRTRIAGDRAGADTRLQVGEATQTVESTKNRGRAAFLVRTYNARI